MANFIQEIDFAAPSALLTDTVGTDPVNSQTSFTLAQPNAITEVRHILEPASTIIYGLYVRRLDQSKRLIGTTNDFLNTNQRGQSQMPFPIAKGFFQWVEQQIVGALTAQKYTIKYATPLAT